MAPTQTTSEHQGILFPDRAESLLEETYQGYRVFLDYWEPLSTQLRAFYEGLVLRRDSRVFLVYGPQGGGKTMFARKLTTDFNETHPTSSISADPDNLWHRIAGGTHGTRDRLDESLILKWRSLTTLINVTNDDRIPGIRIPADRTWITELKKRVTQEQNRRFIVVIDNAEHAHFLQSLVDLDDASFVTLSQRNETITLAAQRLVTYARHELRGCLFLLLTNNDPFAQSLESGVNGLHQGMLVRAELPLPNPTEKETVVRVNTNRLNPISYWYCIDRAGPSEKVDVYHALSGASTFPESFSAVNAAIRSSTRQGRRARSCLLSLIAFTNLDTIPSGFSDALGDVWRTEFEYKWLSSKLFESRWSQAPSQRDASLVESEWVLRLVVLGEPFVRALISGQDGLETSCSQLLSALQVAEAAKPGTWQQTLTGVQQRLTAALDSWGDVSAVDSAPFWALGQRRAMTYEPVLKRLLPGYDRGVEGFLTYRPDYVVSPFTPCSMLSARGGTPDEINTAIRRDAHVLEFTAINNMTVADIKSYLASKIGNYVLITQEQ